MSIAVTEADRIRISDDMVSATSGLVAAMLKSRMVSREELPGVVRDIHSALIDISIESLSLVEGEESPAELPAASKRERRAVSPESISLAVSKLLDQSTTEVEPAVPHQVRVPPTTTPRPASARPAPPAEARAIAPSQPSPTVAKAPAAKAVQPAPAPAQKSALKAPPSPAPVQAKLPLEVSAPKKAKPREPWSGEERRAKPIKGKSIIETILPTRLSSIEEAITLDYIVCLEDGRRVKDLGAHLATLKMTPDEYRAKWKLPAEYPMLAPSVIIKRTDKRAEIYEMDLVTGKVRKSR